MNFSRRTELQPLPPSPALRCRTTRSTNCDMDVSPSFDRIQILANNAKKLPPSPRWGETCGSFVLVRLLKPRALRLDGLVLHDVHQATVALGGELDGASLQCEQRVIAAATNVHTWVELGAALTDEDLARLDLLAADALTTETLCLGVASVTGARTSLLSCHESPSSGRSRAPAHSARTRLGYYLMPVIFSTVRA